MKILITFTIIFLSFCLNFQNDTNDLIGKWECYHKELEDGTTTSIYAISGKEFKYSCNGLIIELKPDSIGWESSNGLEFKYERQDSILKFGNRHYIIELLNKDELIIRNYDPKGISLSNFRTKFKKID